MQEINGRTVIGRGEVMIQLENYVFDKKGMTLDDLCECLEVHYDTLSEDLIIMDKPFNFKDFVAGRSGELSTNDAGTIYDNSPELEKIYTFEEFICVCSAHFHLDDYEMSRFEDIDSTYITNEDGDVFIRNAEDYATFCLDYCDMGAQGSNDPDVDRAFFEFEKETGVGYDDLKKRWFNIIHSRVMFS